MIEISGTTRIFPVVGWPVEQVRAPKLFNAYFKANEIDARVVPLKIVPGSLSAQAVRMLMGIENVGGILVSIPHKPIILESIDTVTERARVAGACNAIFKRADGAITGDLIDGEGFVRALERIFHPQSFAFGAARALVVGSGGVGSAVAAAFASRGLKYLGLCDTRTEQVEALRDRLRQAFPHSEVEISSARAAGYDVVVNCTPLGMHEADPMPIDLDGVASSCIVADCVMKIETTRLLLEAQARGCIIQRGKEMLIEQAPLYLELFGWPGVSSDVFRALGAL